MKYDEDRVFRETPLLDEFDERTKAIADKKKASQLQVQLEIISAVLANKENERKPSAAFRARYRDGRDSLNFFFDLLNHISGYSEAYYGGEEMDPEASHPHSLIMLKGVHNMINHHDIRA